MIGVQQVRNVSTREQAEGTVLPPCSPLQPVSDGLRRSRSVSLQAAHTISLAFGLSLVPPYVIDEFCPPSLFLRRVTKRHACILARCADERIGLPFDAPPVRVKAVRPEDPVPASTRGSSSSHSL